MKTVFILIHKPDELTHEIKGVFGTYEEAKEQEEKLNLPWQLFIEEHKVQSKTTNNIYPKNTPKQIELCLCDYLEGSEDENKEWKDLDFNDFDTEELVWSQSWYIGNPQYIRENLV